MVIWVTRLNSTAYLRLVIDVLVDAEDEAIVEISGKTLFSDSIAGLEWRFVIILTAWIVGCDPNMFTDVDVVIVAVVLIALDRRPVASALAESVLLGSPRRCCLATTACASLGSHA